MEPAAESIEKLTDGPVGVGTRFRAKWKGGPPVEVVMLKYDRPDTWEGHNGGRSRWPSGVASSQLLRAPNCPSSSMHGRTGGSAWPSPLLLLGLRRGEKVNMTYVREVLEP